MRAARARVLEATRDAGIYFLDICTDRNVEAQIDDGVMICTGGARVGRAYTGRDRDCVSTGTEG
jgi:hypothetical protein